MTDPQITVAVQQPQVTVEQGVPVVMVESPSNTLTVTASGPPGPAGSPGSAMAITQATAQSTWTLNHNLGFYPNVTVLDDLGRQVITSVTYLSANTVQIAFNRPFSGIAYLS